MSPRTEDLLRELAPQVLGAVVRRYGHFDTAEDATQEALLAAVTQWPRDGMPDNPRAWLITVASRRLTDLLRSEQARRRREDTAATWELSPSAEDRPPDADDTLILLFMCCHPALSPASQIALTLRAVGGLTTAEIARAFLVPEATMTRRISRAKKAVKDSATPFAMPADADTRLDAVLHVLYLVFNEGYASTSGPDLHRVELSAEAIRLTRIVRRLLPEDPEVAGLLALMLLTDARRPARTASWSPWPSRTARGGWPTRSPRASRWSPRRCRGVGPARTSCRPPSPRCTPRAPSAEETDWPQIVALYELLLRVSDNPVVALNHAVAVAMARGPAAGLARLAEVETDERLAGDHRPLAVRAHLLERAGDHAAAREAYLAAADRALSLPQQRYLNAQAARL